MKRILALITIGFSLSACGGVADNPDEGFDSFYQGSPQETDNSNTASSSGGTIKIPETLEADGFSFSGGDEQYQCTVTCTPK